MEELYSIMRDFLEVDYNQESLICLLNVVEASYDSEKQKEAKLIANSVRCYLKAMREELGAAVSRLDLYIVTHTKK